MVRQMDAGDVIATETVPITSLDTYQTLLQKMLLASEQLIRNHFHSILHQTFCEVPQNPDEVSFGYNLQTADTYIN